MNRTEFREAVFKRDKYACVVCEEKAVDAHHLFERRLWPNGGYFINNGVSLCSECHLSAEKCVTYPFELAAYAGIDKIAYPPCLEKETIGSRYDKWGNLADGSARGPLFYDEAFRKAVGADYVNMFDVKVKYPRTPHLPWSGEQDDLILDMFYLEGREVVITEKMDGENTTLYRNGYHARSVESEYHPTRTWVKNFHSMFSYDIPENYRICGENLWATHSIKYDDLTSYFLGFSAWRDDICLSWDETIEWFNLLGITSVPVLTRGIWPLDLPKLDLNTQEGYVIRLADEYKLSDFTKSIGKFVRKGHVQTDDHWKFGSFEENGLKLD